VRDLHFKTAAHKFTAIPKAAARLACHNKYGACEETHQPSRDKVDLSEIHTGILVLKTGKPIVKNVNRKIEKLF
jgi:hypothetical protein